MEINRRGCTRFVLLTKRYAFKFPNFWDEYRLGLKGLLANLSESQFSSNPLPGFCPVLFSLPFGLLVVMPRLQILTDDEFLSLDFEKWRDRGDYVICAEAKSDSLGWLGGEVVAVDYGN